MKINLIKRTTTRVMSEEGKAAMKNRNTPDLQFKVYERGKETKVITRQFVISRKAMEMLDVNGDKGIAFGNEGDKMFILVVDGDYAQALKPSTRGNTKANTFVYNDAQDLLVEAGVIPAEQEVGFAQKFSFVKIENTDGVETEEGEDEVKVYATYEVVADTEETSTDGSLEITEDNVEPVNDEVNEEAESVDEWA